ncbi:MAG TPA: zinc-binding alcohol dehydrogenase family protein [Candidatus Paenibacillus intestinavium]|nr:zinc-binding alcohol dehydrogenase family protein [Candidatus Paenibacillus intestinavium]
MKAIVCEEVGRLVIHERLSEPKPKENYAVVQIRRIGICGTDYHAYRGKQPFFTYPRILGHELAGEIIQISDNDLGLHEGDQVSIIPYFHCDLCQACMQGKFNCCNEMEVFGVHVDGGMMERVAVPIKYLIKTNDLSLDQAVLLEPLAIGAHAIARSGLQAGQTALVIGAGPIGLGIMALIHSMGAQAIAMDVNEERLKFAESWGNAAYTVNALQDPIQKVAELTDNQFASVVVDATGNAESMMNAFNYTSHGGSLIYVGLFKGDITFHDPDFHRKELTLLGSRNATRQDFETVINAMSRGHIVAEQYITHRCKFELLTETFEEWLLPQSKVIKAVVEI